MVKTVDDLADAQLNLTKVTKVRLSVLATTPPGRVRKLEVFIAT